MTEKGLSDSGRRSAELRYEWQSFLGLLPVLDLRPMDPVLYQRCLTAVWRSRKSAISRTDLQQAAGLGFQAETLDFDLLVAQLVREGILEPIVSSPFHFQIRRRNWTNPESAYAADDRLSLSAISREEQTARFRMLGLLGCAYPQPPLAGEASSTDPQRTGRVGADLRGDLAGTRKRDRQQSGRSDPKER